jgi:GIY-YIG catalytic domain
MKVSELIPEPQHREGFLRNRERFVSEKSGCYALTTFEGVVLYVGLASNVRKRMNDHLDSPIKTRETPLGRAVWFCWIECEELEKVERTWMNIHMNAEGALPILNSVYSPVAI